MNNYLKNKTVILVGPAPTVINRYDYIESFDVVVRLNNSFNTKGLENDIGVRTDLLYLNNFETNKVYNKKILTDKYKIISDFNIKYIINKKGYSVENLKPLKKDYKKYKKYKNFEKAKNSGLGFNIGVLSIMDLLSYDIKSLEVCGFTFYDKSYNVYNENHRIDLIDNKIQIQYEKESINSKLIEKNRKHPQLYQKLFLLELFEDDNRLKFDKETYKYLIRETV
jgi:hypothetical protein